MDVWQLESFKELIRHAMKVSEESEMTGTKNYDGYRTNCFNINEWFESDIVKCHKTPLLTGKPIPIKIITSIRRDNINDKEKTNRNIRRKR